MKEDIIFNIFTIFTCLFLIFLQINKKSRYLNIIQLQNIIWLAAFLIYLFRIVDYYPLNNQVYFCILLYLIFCNIASLIPPVSLPAIRIGNKSNNVLNDLYLKYVDDINQRVSKKCILGSVGCWIVSIPMLRKSIPVIIRYGPSNGLSALRNRIYSQFCIYTTFEMLLITYIIRPVLIVSVIYFAQMIAQKKVNKKYAVVAVLDAFWLILATAGRALLVSMVMYIVLAVIAYDGMNVLRLLKKYKKYVIPGFILGVAIIEIISLRVNKKHGFIEEGILYFFSGFSYFSTMINQNIAEPFHLMGKGMFSFIIDPLVLFFKALGINFMSGGSQYLSTLANPILPIGPDMTTNATASTLLTFYSDFGILGAAIGGFLIGRISVNTESQINKDCNPVTFGRYLFVICGVVTTVQNYPFVGSAAIMTWIFLGLLLK